MFLFATKSNFQLSQEEPPLTQLQFHFKRIATLVQDVQHTSSNLLHKISTVTILIETRTYPIFIHFRRFPRFLTSNLSDHSTPLTTPRELR